MNTPNRQTTQPLLQVRDVCVSYGKVQALHNINLTIHPGEIVTVIGPNGAGKTTLLSALMGLLPLQGEVQYQGQKQGADRQVEMLVRQGFTLVPEKRELFAEMSVHDNLLLGAFDRYRRGLRDQNNTLEEIFTLFPRLRERSKQHAGTLSGGERQMLAMGRAMMAKPQLLMLDEPSLGLAPLIVKEIFRTIVQLRSTGVSVLLVEQNARAALQVSDHAYVLESGEIALQGASVDLLHDPRVVDSYLGLGNKAAAQAHAASTQQA